MTPVAFSALYLPLLFSALSLVICIFAFLFSRAYIKRRTSREWILEEGILPEIRDEVNGLLKAIDDITDRDITLIKERENSLKALLVEVDKRLKVYIREMEKRRDAEETYAALSLSGNNAASSVDESFSSPPNDKTYLDLGKLRYRLKKQEAADTSAGSSAVVIPQVDSASAASPGISSLNDQIRSLLKDGIPAEKIALRLGVSISEVEFAAALLERQ